MKISSQKFKNDNKITDKRTNDPLSGYVLIITEACSGDGEISVCAYSERKGLTYIGTTEPYES